MRKILGRYGLLLVVLGLLSLACVREVELPIRQEEPILVVEGLLTDEPPPYVIKLSFSGPLRTGLGIETRITPVNGALVTVSDGQGKVVRLEQDPLTPTYYWLRDSTFRGQVGRAYTLSIKLDDGRTYVSEPEVLPAVPPIERAYAEYKEQFPNAGNQPDLYQVYIDSRDPATAGNYYRWSAYGYSPRQTTGGAYCCRLCWVPFYGAPGTVLSDVLINGKRIVRQSVLNMPVYTYGRQYVEVQQFALTRSAYQFWKSYEEQTTRTGSIFDPQPAPIEGNIHRSDDATVRALGYFGASAISRRRLVIPGDTLAGSPKLQLELRYGNTFISPGSCLAFPGSQLGPPLPW